LELLTLAIGLAAVANLIAKLRLYDFTTLLGIGLDVAWHVIAGFAVT
jgi:hypothetical protein